MIRLGLIGAGRWGKNIIRSLGAFSDAKLTRVSSRNPLTQAVTGPSCAVSPDWRELVEAGDLDGLIIAAPPDRHAEIAAAAIEKNLPVLIEKPVTMDLGQAQNLLNLAQKTGALAMVDQIFLFHPAYQALKRKAVELGPVKSLSSWGANWGPFRKDISPLWDYAPHDIYLCLDLIGAKPKTAGAELKQRREEDGGIGEDWEIRLEFTSASALIHAGNLSEKKQRRLEAHFENGALIFDDQAESKLVLGSGQALKIDDTPPLNIVLRAFIDAVKTGNKDLSGLRLAVDVVEILSECAASSNRS